MSMTDPIADMLDFGMRNGIIANFDTVMSEF